MSELIQEEFPSLSRKQSGVVAVIILLGMCASAVMYQITILGPGVSPDAAVYIETARTLLRGNGFLVDGLPMTHYPPVFPLLLAIGGLFTGGDILLAARLLCALFFGVNLVLLALAVFMSTRHDILATGCAILIFLLSAQGISIHSMVLSEAPFIAFSMGGVILLSCYVVRPSLRRLALASFMVGVAAATRYIGIILFPAAVLALFVFGNQCFRHRIKDILVFLSVAGLPLLSWVIRNLFVAESATNRTFSFHPFSLSHVQNFIVCMYDFVLPISISGWTKFLHVGVAAVLFILSMRFTFRKMHSKQSASTIGIVFPSLLVIYSVLYVAFLFVSISFFDAHTPVDHRLLLPVFFALIVACTSFVNAISHVSHQKWIWYGYVFMLLFSVSINAVPAISTARYIHNNGSGYTARHWRESETLAWLSRVPGTVKIYSNGPDAIFFHTQKKAYMIPHKVFPTTHRENESYRRELSQMIQECEKGNALIVYLVHIRRWYLAPKEEIESQFNIVLARAMADGVVYGVFAMDK